MTATSVSKRFMDLLGVRLGLVLGLALLPIGVIAMMQSADLIASARDHSEAALAGETLRAVRPQLTAIKRAQGAAQVIAALRIADLQACNSVLARLVGQGGYAGIALHRPDGSMRCSAPADAPTLAGSAAFGTVVTSGQPALAGQSVDGDPLRLSVLVPEPGDGGAVAGVAVVTLADATPDAVQRDGFALILLDPAGIVLWASIALPEARDLLPADPEFFPLADNEGTFSARSAAGADRAYSLVEVAEGEVFAIGTWPQETAGLEVWQSVPPLILPALMWAVSLVVAWLASEKLVTRHIRRLRGAIIDFAGGSRSVRPLPLQGAPQEIRDTAEAFARMTQTILRDEAELEDALHGKEILLREVHHRVKNNLQLIASIVNMQIRRTRSDEARRIMQSLQERMLSLATIHNGLYQTADVSEIRADRLFPGIVEQIVRASIAQGRQVRVSTHFDEVYIPLEQAVPLALLITEALSNGLRFATACKGDQPSLSLSLQVDPDGMTVLDVLNDAAGSSGRPLAGEDTTGIGTQLLLAFTRQLGGTLDRQFANGKCRLTVTFRPGAKGMSL